MDNEPMQTAVYHGGNKDYENRGVQLQGLDVEGLRGHEDQEDPNTPHANPIKVENLADPVSQEPARHESPDILEGNAHALTLAHDRHSGRPAQTEEQPTELRLSDFEVVDTLGKFIFIWKF
jgi:hypothetical protein